MLLGFILSLDVNLLCAFVSPCEFCVFFMCRHRKPERLQRAIQRNRHAKMQRDFLVFCDRRPRYL